MGELPSLLLFVEIFSRSANRSDNQPYALRPKLLSLSLLNREVTRLHGYIHLSLITAQLNL
jgi:hypothetical protein